MAGQVRDLIATALLAQRGHLLGWVPVALALGIGLWFAWPVEPGWPDYAALGLIGTGGLAASRVLPPAWAPLAVALVLMAVGAGIAGARAHAVAGPVLDWRYYGAIEGRVVKVDRSASDKTRLTLDEVRLKRLSPARTPARVRVSLHGDQDWLTPEPGMRVMLTGHLSPPSGPVEPGGFDFARMAWFDRLGAVGYSRTPALLLAPPEPGWALWLARGRAEASAWIRAAMPGETGAVAAAIMVGDRSAMSAGTVENLRHSNLAHLLAISGLHMGLLTGFIFALVRTGLALVPVIALRVPVKKIAAAVALLAGAGYLALSGGSVATERAFIMVSVMLVAVLFGRRALTLRAVAIAAVIVLLHRPEELTSPGFQMSFAATVALVAVFGALRDLDLPQMPRWLRPPLAVVLSSLVAGLATAPFAAAHFNMIAHYGLIANLLSVPLMGVLVMPAAVLAVCLAPLGLHGIGFWLMDKGLAWILGVAEAVASRQGAVGHVPSPDAIVLPILALGALVVILWRGPGRWAGFAPAGLAFVLWAGSERPAVLISDRGTLIGVMTEEGRALSSARGDGFAADSWLENDGAPVAQAEAAERAAFETEGRTLRFEAGGLDVLQVRGKTALAELQGCGGADLLITNVVDEAERPCDTYDLMRLRETGALALLVAADKAEIVTARQITGDRLWNTPALSRDRDRRVAAAQ